MNTQLRKQFITLVRKRVQPGSGSSLEFLDTRTWNYPVTNIRSIIQSTPFVVVGGVATRLYMPERMTLDLGILILTSDALQLYQELLAGGATREGNLSIGGSSWRLPDNTLLDVIESNQPWVIQAIQNHNLSPDDLPIIPLPYLVVMKMQASRTQDLTDISRMLGGADETALNQVRTAVRSYCVDAVEDLESLIQIGKLERRN
jgi:hypothetical protein